eukprot:1152498-Pelagomonas_calceolata.AAC.2
MESLHGGYGGTAMLPLPFPPLSLFSSIGVRSDSFYLSSATLEAGTAISRGPSLIYGMPSTQAARRKPKERSHALQEVRIGRWRLRAAKIRLKVKSHCDLETLQGVRELAGPQCNRRYLVQFSAKSTPTKNYIQRSLNLVPSMLVIRSMG